MREEQRKRDHARERLTETQEAEEPELPDTDADFAEEWTPSETDPAARDPRKMGSESPHRPTRTDGGPYRPV